MNYVLARLSRYPSKLFKIISDTNLYKEIAYNENLYIDYDPDHNLDEECWFQIKNFSEKPLFLDFLHNELDSKEYEQIDNRKIDRIQYLLSVQDNGLYFQKTTKSSFLRKKFLNFGENVTVEDNNTRIVINSQPDAIYFNDKDVLIFKNLATISSIFNGISELYKEATDEQVEDFLAYDFIKTSKEFTFDKVSTPNRKRISIALNTLGDFDPTTQSRIIIYIKEYCSHKLIFNEQENSFEIDNDDDIKYLLYGIEQRYYTTQIGYERRLANSIIKLN